MLFLQFVEGGPVIGAFAESNILASGFRENKIRLRSNSLRILV